MKVAALILAGSKSTRMGEDKGLLKKYGNYWVELIQEELPVSVECFTSVGKHNLEAYKAAGFENLVIDKEGLEDFAGPIKGVLSGLQEFAAFDKLLVIPCDMINLKTEHFELLLKEDKTACFGLNGMLEPLPFVLNPKDFMKINSEKLKNLSLQQVLEMQGVEVLKIQDVYGFKNYNSKVDL